MIAPNFPGLSQLGVFTIAGIAAAVATARWLLPALLPPDWIPPRPGEIGAWADWLLEPRPKLALAFGAVGLLLLAVLIIRSPPLWENDIAALSPVPRALLQLDQELRAALGAPEVGRLIVVTAPDAETALQAALDYAGAEADISEATLAGLDAYAATYDVDFDGAAGIATVVSVYNEDSGAAVVITLQSSAGEEADAAILGLLDSSLILFTPVE